MTDQLRLGGLGLTDDLPAPPHPGGAESWPSIPPLDSSISVPIPLASGITIPVPPAGGITIPVPLDAAPTVPIPEIFF
jgi:hypothetical protein